MKTPSEIRQMWGDAFRLLDKVYEDEKALELPAEEFFGHLLDKTGTEARKYNHPMANDLLIAAYDQAERLWKERHNDAAT